MGIPGEGSEWKLTASGCAASLMDRGIPSSRRSLAGLKVARAAPHSWGIAVVTMDAPTEFATWPPVGCSVPEGDVPCVVGHSAD
eukprot:15386552-Alexandrium_andersonii.AAC.1